MHIGRLADAVASWSARNGDNPAVIASDGTFSWTDLSTATRALAAALAAAQVGPRTPVALATGRSRFSLAALLAVWWLGATAVLVDERHPPTRLRHVLMDSDAQFVLGGAWPTGAEVPAVRVVPPAAAMPLDDALVPRHPVGTATDDCAYIIYTSGTTGHPKGVEISYGNLAAFLDALATLQLKPEGIGINAVSPAFDGWLWCALLYLLHGQGMAIVDATRNGAAEDLFALVAKHDPRTICLTPTLLSALEEIPPADVAVVAGEACPPGLAARLAGIPRVLNVYGPTETTIAATWADTAHGDDPATIGRALPGYLTYVLDSSGNPVPPGSAGELYIGGPAVGRGYRNLPQLSSERFLPDRSAGGGSRMYRTGDLVRARPDGQLEFIGRADDQVKVRGFRVELGELERVALGVPEVQAAAAFTIPARDSLGLAVTAASWADPDQCAALVRQRCADTLPDFMIPGVVDVVTALPTLPTGKVDRVALASAQRPGTSAGRPPGTPRERQVCQVWGDVLSHPVNDVDVSFFDIGGHSLLAARAVGSLRRATGLPVSVRHLLENSTAAGLAAELDKLAQGAGDAEGAP